MRKYGDQHPELVDDRKPMVLVILDGLGDRPLVELEGWTPAEAAATPNLDALAARGASGLHIPFGPGRTPSSEVSHWAMFGYQQVPFVGRGVLEARGHGHALNGAHVYSYGAVRPSEIVDGKVWVTGRAPEEDFDDAAALFEAVDGFTVGPIGFELRHVTRGEAILAITGGASHEVTDSDPLFDHVHPWLRPVPHADAVAPKQALMTATAIEEFLGHARGLLVDHPINAARIERGLPALDVLTTKWTGRAASVPSFEEVVGVQGAMVTSSALYRGFAATLGMWERHLAPLRAHGADLAARLEAAADLIGAGAGFVHVHTKAPDEAGHSKDPTAKLRVLEELDDAFAILDTEPLGSAVVAVTGDHATPSSGGLIHSGDPTPFVVAASTVRPDRVDSFGEITASHGSLGHLRATDILPLMLGYANRPMFLGTRVTAHPTIGLPDSPIPMSP